MTMKKHYPAFSSISSFIKKSLLLLSVTLIYLHANAQCVATSTILNQVSCFGSCDGSAMVMPSGGTSPCSYLWSNGNTYAQNFNLCPGTYSCTITDALSCTSSTSVVITQPATAVHAGIIVTDQTCAGVCDGKLSATATGGSSPYSYMWSNGAVGVTATYLCAAGAYSLTVTDVKGCTATSAAQIGTKDTVKVTASVLTPPTCGGCDGTAGASLSGGTGAYTIQWSNGSYTGTGLCAGYYTVSITDASGCQGTSSLLVLPADTIHVSVTATQLASCAGKCNGILNAFSTGGTPGYSYSWSNGATGASVSGLCIGTYTVTVTDSKGCEGVTAFSLGYSDSVRVTTAVIKKNTCMNDCKGVVVAKATGGTAGYTYSWFGGTTGDTLKTACSYGYGVQVTDANGCLAYYSPSVGLGYTDSIDISAKTVGFTKCSGVCNGTAIATATGGTGTYTYKWSSGETNMTGVTLCAGGVGITVTDANGCKANNYTYIGFTDTIHINTISSTLATCNSGCDGHMIVSASGGTAGYTYSWSNGNVGANISNLCVQQYYTLTVTDAQGCTGTANRYIGYSDSLQVIASVVKQSTCSYSCDGTVSAIASHGSPAYFYTWAPSGANSATATAVCAGSYTVTVTDLNGCINTATVYLTTSNFLNVTASVLKEDCFSNGSSNCKGKAKAVATNGTPGYSYTWSNTYSGDTLLNACSMAYTVTVTDANGCFGTTTVTIGYSDTLNYSSNVINSTCGLTCNGSVSVNVSTGHNPYTYNWSNGSTNANQTGLCFGSYTLTITDALGCSSTSNSYLQQPFHMSTYTTTDSCKGDGTATVYPYSGVSPYTYLWSTSPPQTTQTATKLSAGLSLSGTTYTVTVTDAGGCFLTTTAIINMGVSNLQSSSTETAALCGKNNGSITLTNFGGTTPYSYLWNTGATTATINNLSPGYYTVTVSDAAGCRATFYKYVDSYTSINASTGVTPASCANTGGAVSCTATGGIAPYTYLWSNGQTSSSISNLSSNGYGLTITDATGCLAYSGNYVSLQSNCFASISGRVYNDMNGNCVLDANESGLSQQMIKSTQSYDTWSWWDGYYYMQFIPTGGADTISQQPHSYWQQVCPASPAYYTLTPAAGTSYNNLDFYDQPKPLYNDVKIILRNDVPQPGFTFYQSVVVYNKGTSTMSGTATFQYDSLLNIVTSGNASSLNTTTHTLTYTYNNLPPFQSAYFYSEFQVTVSTPLSTVLKGYGIAYPLTGDSVTKDNYDTTKSVVVGSYDPNEKSVVPAGSGSAGYIGLKDSVLTYTIHFQNTGTYRTTFVNVIDTIDPNLDLTTLKVEGCFAAGQQILPTLSVVPGNAVKFSMPACQLQPASADELNSSGSIVYSIQQKKNLADGTQMKNRADIYFDYNTAILTNTTVNTISLNPLGIADRVHNDGWISVFPNPANAEINVVIQTDAHSSVLKLIDILGNCVYQHTLNGNSYKIDVSGFARGIYFIEAAEQNGNLHRKKIIIQ